MNTEAQSNEVETNEAVEPSTEVASTEVASTEVASTEVASTEVASTEVASTEVASTEVASTEVASNEQAPAAAAATAPAAPKAPRDKGKRAIEIYNRELPKQAEMGKGWRRHVQTCMMTELAPMTLAASASHFNTARILNGGVKNTRGPRKPKDNAAAPAGNAAANEAPASAPSSETWCVELNDGTKTWYAGSTAANEAADKIGRGKVKNVFRDLEVEAEG